MYGTVTVGALVFIQDGIEVRECVGDALMSKREYGRWRQRRDGKETQTKHTKETPDERVGTR